MCGTHGRARAQSENVNTRCFLTSGPEELEKMTCYGGLSPQIKFQLRVHLVLSSGEIAAVFSSDRSSYSHCGLFYICILYIDPQAATF